MCGIIGYIGYTPEEVDLQRAVASLRHRGPDGSGSHVDPSERVGLGHARLSIIDLETGDQPLYADDQNLVLVCNGEIYDHERIRRELEAQGHRFSTRSDSEVILHLYREHGEAFVHHLRGEFAFLLLDKKRRRLIAARDRFGIKPLFFAHRDGRYLFGSEAKAIFATGCHAPAIDPAAVRDFLSGVIPDCLFEGIEALPPGHLMTVDLASGEVSTDFYWDLDLALPEEDASSGPDERAAIDTVRQGVDEAVGLRLRADVPVGVYLSGGIDSAIVAASAARQTDGPIKAFTISFPEDSNFDELELARKMAEKIGADFHSVTCDRATLLAHAEDSLWVSELPFHNFHGVGKFLLSKLARRHVKVVLTGEGSDEVFLGYPHFQPGKGSITERMENRKESVRKVRGKHLEEINKAIGFIPWPEIEEHLSREIQGFFSALFLPKHRPRLSQRHPLDLLRKRLPRHQTDPLPPVRKIQHFTIKSLLAPYLLTVLGDRQEMGHSLEGRTPFLDHPLFEACRRIPDRLKIRDGVEKYVLREAFRDDLIDEIYQREKWPFSAPPMELRRGVMPELDDLLDRYLSNEAIRRGGIFVNRRIQRLRRLCRLLFFDCSLKRKLQRLLVVVLSVQILEKLYVQDFEANLGARCPED
ncbi:asparagine synthase (glutamine-hydrolyzing) [Haloferula sp. A504]|uniref:asparagine synthase (glutamine-hydrolyzing) n=1 Tax=Haloferula sp. A504 TaxID=3373601 RepID=UPI0031C07B7F|nr:asparagine synthase (glutamine-hydrolyzing) [Verrucomicrobiaceae bacterium E54]